MQSCLEPYKQNENYVEHWIQEAKIPVSQMKLHTDCDDQYVHDMWAHKSNVNKHCAKKKCLRGSVWVLHGMLGLPLLPNPIGA